MAILLPGYISKYLSTYHVFKSEVSFAPKYIFFVCYIDSDIFFNDDIIVDRQQIIHVCVDQSVIKL